MMVSQGPNPQQASRLPAIVLVHVPARMRGWIGTLKNSWARPRQGSHLRPLLRIGDQLVFASPQPQPGMVAARQDVPENGAVLRHPPRHFLLQQTTLQRRSKQANYTRIWHSVYRRRRCGSSSFRTSVGEG